jgi:MoaD family protein
MIKVTCKYFTTVLSITKKEIETFEISEGTTVNNFMDNLAQKYGNKFRQNVFYQVTMQGKQQEAPNIFLNKKRIQWTQDFPDGLQTKLKDGDAIWLGLIAGGG